MGTYNEVMKNLDELNLTKIKDCLYDYLDEISNKNISFIEALKDLTEKEINFRNERAAQINIKISNFPFERTIDGFDFDYQPSINKQQIFDLASLRFIDNAANIMFIGSPGTGKTHLSVAIGTIAASQHISTYFIHFNDLINKIKKAYHENRIDSIVKHYLKYKLLIIDEIGYLPVDKIYSQIFFQLIAARYEKKSTIITTNQPFSKWPDVFGDTTLSAAIIDRLCHHSAVIKISGRSYRIKDLLEDDLLSTKK